MVGQKDPAERRRGREKTLHRRLPKAVWALGVTSLLMDASSEAIHSLLPLFLTTTLGASAMIIGLVEGLGEAVAAFFKLVGGATSDRLPRRKPVVVLGYGLAAFSKPLFALAASVSAVIAARLIDRTGKGLRGAARDALIADLVAPEHRGAAFGLRQSLDTLGALFGPLAASGLMLLFAGNIRGVYGVVVIPAVLAVLVLIRYVHEPARRPAQLVAPARPLVPRSAAWRDELAALPAAFWITLSGGVLLTMARIGESFLLLASEDLGVAAAAIPLAYVLMNSVYATSAWPAGRLADRWGAARLLVLGALLLAIADLLLGMARGTLMLGFGIAIWGLHMGLTQSLMMALVARTLPAARRGIGFGIFHMSQGLAALAGGIGGGMMWDSGGATLAYPVAAGLALTSAISFLLPARTKEIS